MNVLFRCAVRLARASLFGAVALGTSAWVSAAHAAERASPEPAASTPFKHYQSWRDAPLQDWREANERVGEIGGWRTYLREMQQDGDGTDGGQAHHGH